jgi:RNA polymerase sigma-70 factor (ECF subfamily)
LRPEAGAHILAAEERANRPVDETDLLRRVGAGDRAALKALYDRHSDALQRFLRYRLRDPFEAGDVVHEVFLEIWRGAARFEGRASPRTWIFGIARRKAVDRMRRGAREVTMPEPGAGIADEWPDPESVVAVASDAARLRACIGTLSDFHRSAIHLAYYEELSYGEIAAIEGVPVGTVKTRVMHAKRLLLHCLTTTRKP